ncbi:hypothetical protein F4678DRAFT_486006, partial [Xylaria arbuscula]
MKQSPLFKMKEEFNTFTPLARTSNDTLTLDDCSSFTDSLWIGRKNNTDGQDTERSINIPVILSMVEAKGPLNTVQVNVSLSYPPTYGELVKNILYASRKISWNYFEEYDNRAQLISALENTMLGSGCVYFIWDFAPHIQFTETGYTEPGYGKTDAAHLSPEELVEYFHTVDTGKIKYIFVGLKVEREIPIKTSPKEPGHLQQKREQGKGVDSESPGAVPEKSCRLTTPSQQPLLPKHKDQTASSRQGMLEARDKPLGEILKELVRTMTNSTTPPEQAT